MVTPAAHGGTNCPAFLQVAFCPGASPGRVRIRPGKFGGNSFSIFRNRSYATHFQVLAKASLAALRSALVDTLRIFGNADPRSPVNTSCKATQPSAERPHQTPCETHDWCSAHDQARTHRCVRNRCAASDRGCARRPDRTRPHAWVNEYCNAAQSPGRALVPGQALVPTHGRAAPAPQGRGAASGGTAGRGPRPEGVGGGGGGGLGGPVLPRLCEFYQKGPPVKKIKNFASGGRC